MLVVEDDDVNLLIARHVLEKAGYQVDEASNGEAAVEAVKQQQYSIIFMDIEMPLMNGMEATREIRKLSEGNMPIIALTAYHMPEKLDEFKAAGMDDFIIKPFGPDKLQRIISQYLDSQP